jgi:hypothetical protein
VYKVSALNDGIMGLAKGSLILLCGAMLMSCFHLNGQDIPAIHENDLEGIAIHRNDSFDGSSLWGYMNGGADIYLEYGFEVLRVEEFSAEDENIKMELFRMYDPLSAFGIYSIKTFKCNESNVLIRPDCLNKYQFQLLHGVYYVQLINESGSEKAKQHMTGIASALIQKLGESDLELPIKYLTDSLHLSPADIKMVKGELGLQDKASHLAIYLKGIDDYQLYIAKAEKEGIKQSIYEIVFGEQGLKKVFLERIDAKIQLIHEYKNTLVFMKL